MQSTLTSLLKPYGVHTSQITPLNLPDVLGGERKSSSLSFASGGLGRGKNQIRKLLQTCVYTVAARREGRQSVGLAGWGSSGLISNQADMI